MAKALNGSSDICFFPPPELHSNDDDDSVSTLSGRVPHSLVLKDEDFNSLLINQSNNSSASSEQAGDEFSPNLSLTERRLEAARFHYLKQQLIKNQLSAARRTQNIAKGTRPLGFFSSSASPPVLKSQSSSGMRALFINPGKESSGTGVFLPRQPGSHSEPRKQPGFSTALPPTRVVQDLNLNLEDLCVYPRATNHGMGLTGNQKHSSGRNRSSWVAGAADRLPSEWTY